MGLGGKPEREDIYIYIHMCVCVFIYIFTYVGFAGSSAGKETTCNARDPDSIPRLGRPTGEGIGYPPQYAWTYLVAQTVKNLPAVWET